MGTPEAAERGARWLAGGALVLAGLLALPALRALGFLWQSREFYGHAYAIPPVAAYLAWGSRRPIAAALRRPRPPRFGAALVLAVAALEVVAVMGDAGFAAGLGIPALLAATGYAVGGGALLRPLLLPLLFLAAMVPPPRFLTDELLVHLKLLVTRTSVSLLQAAGHTVGADGNQILLPDHTLFVADACSGLTSIVTLLPLAWIVAWFLSHGVWRRIAVVASVVPLALGANVLRVIVTVQLVASRGIEFAQGLLHESFGTATYALGTLAVIGVARLLR